MSFLASQKKTLLAFHSWMDREDPLPILRMCSPCIRYHETSLTAGLAWLVQVSFRQPPSLAGRHGLPTAEVFLGASEREPTNQSLALSSGVMLVRCCEFNKTVLNTVKYSKWNEKQEKHQKFLFINPLLCLLRSSKKKVYYREDEYKKVNK